MKSLFFLLLIMFISCTHKNDVAKMQVEEYLITHKIDFEKVVVNNQKIGLDIQILVDYNISLDEGWCKLLISEVCVHIININPKVDVINIQILEGDKMKYAFNLNYPEIIKIKEERLGKRSSLLIEYLVDNLNNTHFKDLTYSIFILNKGYPNSVFEGDFIELVDTLSKENIFQHGIPRKVSKAAFTFYELKKLSNLSKEKRYRELIPKLDSIWTILTGLDLNNTFLYENKLGKTFVTYKTRPR